MIANISTPLSFRIQVKISLLRYAIVTFLGKIFKLILINIAWIMHAKNIVILVHKRVDVLDNHIIMKLF